MQATGTSTSETMSQKVITDQLNLKLSLSRIITGSIHITSSGYKDLTFSYSFPNKQYTICFTCFDTSGQTYYDSIFLKSKSASGVQFYARLPSGASNMYIDYLLIYKW